MTRLLNLDNETGDLSQYDSVVSGGANVLSVEEPGLIGTSYVLSFEINDTSTMYVYADFSLSTNEFYLRLYLNPNSLTMASGNRFDMARVVHSTGPPWNEAVLVFSYDGTSYEVRALFYDDAGTFYGTAYHDITDEEHFVEIWVERATSDVASDGAGYLYIDGSLVETESGIDNYDNFTLIERVWLCAIGIDSGTSGTFFLDECAIDDSDLIGPMEVPETEAPPFIGGRQRARLDLMESLAYGLLKNDVSLSGMTRFIAYFGVDYLNRRWLWTYEGEPVSDAEWAEIEGHLDTALLEIMTVL